MQCSICNNLLPETLQYVKPGQLATIFIDEYELSVSAQAGSCSECRLLFDAISLRREQWADSKEESLSIVVKVAIGKPIQIVWNKAGIFLQIFRLEAATETNNSNTSPETIGTTKLVPEFSGSEECLTTLQSWFYNCKASHQLCRPAQMSELPTRIIDVGSNAVSTADVSLVATENSMSGEYMALSYCWGNPPVHRVLKTLQSNIDQFKRQICFDSLPLTLQHAVMLTRRLCLRYLWIDALCIIQDDRNDWRREAAKMCDVYSNAAITVVACRSDGSSGGIFGPQKYSECIWVPYKETYVNVSNDYGRDHEYNILLHERSDLDPVHTRAWTLQEAILSNRAVFFTSQEIRWECNTCRHCQCRKISKQYPASLDAEEAPYELYRTWRLEDFFPATTTDEAYEQWLLMYNFYTARVLTNDSDRLVALGGLARRFAEIMKARFGRHEQYLAGIWRGSLPRDLLWHIEFKGLSKIENRRHERPKMWRAPSWSWAAMEADAHRYHFGDLQNRIEILEASTELAGPDPYGQVKDGPNNYMRVKGPMLRDVRFNYDPDAEHGESALQRRFPTISYQGHSLRQAIILPDDDLGQATDEILQDIRQDFAILIVGYSPGGDTHEVLVLLPVPGKGNTFKRFAMARLGPHIREPQENRIAVEGATYYTVTLV